MLIHTYLPNTEHLDEDVAGETVIQHLTDDEDVASQSTLQHDGHVRCVEQLDGIHSTLTTVAVALDWDLDSEALEIDDRGEDDTGSDQVHDIGETLPPESLLESARLVVPGEQEMEQGNDGTFEFWATTSVDSGGRECLPDNGLANVGGNEEGDTRTKTVTLLKEFIEEDDDESSDDELKDEQETNTRAEV